MSKSSFKRKVENQARALQAKNLQIALVAIEEARSAEPESEASVEALDRAHAYVRMAVDWIETSYRPADLRRAAEERGSRNGVEKRQRGQLFTSADTLDELRNIHRADKSAEWHRQQLQAVGIPLGLRSVQKKLKEIRKS